MSRIGREQGQRRHCWEARPYAPPVWEEAAHREGVGPCSRLGIESGPGSRAPG